MTEQPHGNIYFSGDCFAVLAKTGYNTLKPSNTLLRKTNIFKHEKTFNRQY